MWSDFISFTETVAVPFFFDSFKTIFFWVFVAFVAVVILGLLVELFMVFVSAGIDKIQEKKRKQVIYEESKTDPS